MTVHVKFKAMFPWVLILAVLTLSACARLPLYEGAARDRSDIARIIADPKINAGLPMVAVLRKVDDQIIHWNVNTVDVLPGEHRVLVDCEVGSSTTRFEIVINAIAGYRYRSQIELTPGNRSCESVIFKESL